MNWVWQKCRYVGEATCASTDVVRQPDPADI